MERDLLVERTQAGLQRARAEGRTLGRPRKTNQEQRAAMIEGTSAATRSAPWRGCTRCRKRVMVWYQTKFDEASVTILNYYEDDTFDPTEE
jgi:hypothetical protein